MFRRSRASAFADQPWFECLKFGAGTVVAATVAVLTLSAFWSDISVERDLDRRGVTTQARFLETWCGKCSTLPVEFTTNSGRVVRADLPVSGDPDDDTALVRYDPQHPTHVHPSNGVVYDEVVSAALGAGAIIAFGYLLLRFLTAAGSVRSRGASFTLTSTSAAQVSHVHVVEP